jgi:hypothetical protein
VAITCGSPAARQPAPPCVTAIYLPPTVSFHLILLVNDRAIAQEGSHRGDLGSIQGSLCGICGGKCGTGAGVSP